MVVEVTHYLSRASSGTPGTRQIGSCRPIPGFADFPGETRPRIGSRGASLKRSQEKDMTPIPGAPRLGVRPKSPSKVVVSPSSQGPTIMHTLLFGWDHHAGMSSRTMLASIGGHVSVTTRVRTYPRIAWSLADGPGETCAGAFQPLQHERVPMQWRNWQNFPPCTKGHWIMLVQISFDVASLAFPWIS